MTTRTHINLGYNEKQDNLAIRIEAHKRFSTFSLEEWIDQSVLSQAGDVILDIGCGNGNLFPIYAKKLGDKGLIVGVDKSRELLLEARNCQIPTLKLLLQLDVNSGLPFIKDTFNRVISTFAIYYIDDAMAILEIIKDILKPQGEVFLIGPTDNNARELYEFNQKVFNLDYERDEKVSRRTRRLEKEFYPAMKRILGNATQQYIPSKLVFPNKEEFIKYYTATLLFEETVKKTAFAPDRQRLFSIDTVPLEISKEMIVLQGKKYA